MEGVRHQGEHLFVGVIAGSKELPFGLMSPPPCAERRECCPIKARHDILIAYWHIVSTDTNAEDAQVGYRELGADWITSRHGREYQIAKLARQMEKLGATVTVTLPAI